jgi:hypothetical protein
MKQLGKFSAGRPLSYLLSALAGSRSVQDDANKTQPRSAKVAASGSRLLCSSTRSPEEILKITERRWASRYY